MKKFIQLDRGAAVVVAMLAAIVFAIVLLKSGSGQPANTNPPPGPGAASNASPSEATVDLAPSQMNAIKIEPVGTYLFPVEKEAVGSIDFDEDLSVQVFPPYQGKISRHSSNWVTKFKRDSRSIRLTVRTSSRPNQP